MSKVKFDFVKWKPTKGQNVRVDYKTLLEDASDSSKTHNYLDVGNINANPAIVRRKMNFTPRLLSVQVATKKRRERYYFLSDKGFNLTIEQNKSKFSLFTDNFGQNTESKPVVITMYSTEDVSQINSFQPFLLKNDSLLIYSTGSIKNGDEYYDIDINDDNGANSDDDNEEEDGNEDNQEPDPKSSSNSKETFFNFTLCEHPNYNEKINITIGKDVFRQILYDNNFSKTSPNLLQYNYRKINNKVKVSKDQGLASLLGSKNKETTNDEIVDNKEIISGDIASHIFKQIIPDPLSSNRFFFIAYKKLYLAIIVGTGKERHLEVFQYFSDVPIVMCAVSATTIVYCRQNLEGKYIFESAKRTENVFTPNIIQMKDMVFDELPHSFYIFNDLVYINSSDVLPCIWDLSKNTIKQGIENANYQPISDYYMVTVTKGLVGEDDLLTVQGESKVKTITYYDDYVLVGNSTTFLCLQNNKIKCKIDFSPKEKKNNKQMFRVDESLDSIRRILDDNLSFFNENFSQINNISKRINQIEDNFEPFVITNPSED